MGIGPRIVKAATAALGTTLIHGIVGQKHPNSAGQDTKDDINTASIRVHQPHH
jgi:hypothetical protein